MVTRYSMGYGLLFRTSDIARLRVTELARSVAGGLPRGEDFRARWAAHNVRFHRSGHKRLRHPVVGSLDLDYEAMEFPAHPRLTLLAYTAAEQTGDLPAYA